MPENPPPIMQMSALAGKAAVLRWSSSGRGSAIQNDKTGFEIGLRSECMIKRLEYLKSLIKFSKAVAQA